MSFELLKQEVERGMSGKNSGVPMGFSRLNKYVGIRKRIMTIVAGASGSGKSAFIHSSYILNPFEYLLKTNRTDVKLKVIFFSMERSRVYILAKWMSRKIFITEKVLIPIPKLLGWWDNSKLTPDEYDLFLKYEDYMEKLLSVVDIIDGPQNPTGIYAYVKEYAKQNGRFNEENEYHKTYIPTHPNEIVIVIIDHMGLIKTEKGYVTKKEAIDKTSEYCQWFRDNLGYSPVLVTQLNRNLNNPMYLKVDSVEPTIDDIKESGNPGEASDVVISLFDPTRYNTSDKSYKADKFIDLKTGANYFRSVKVLKNSYGEDGIRVGMGFHGATGTFKELPRKEDMEGFDFESVYNGTFFM